MKLVLTVVLQGFPAISGTESKCQGKRQGEAEELYDACGEGGAGAGVRADFLGPSFSLLCYCATPPFPPTLATPEERAAKGWSVPQDICAMMG